MPPYGVSVRRSAGRRLPVRADHRRALRHDNRGVARRRRSLLLKLRQPPNDSGSNTRTRRVTRMRGVLAKDNVVRSRSEKRNHSTQTMRATAEPRPTAAHQLDTRQGEIVTAGSKRGEGAIIVSVPTARHASCRRLEPGFRLIAKCAAERRAPRSRGTSKPMSTLSQAGASRFAGLTPLLSPRSVAILGASNDVAASAGARWPTCWRRNSPARSTR